MVFTNFCPFFGILLLCGLFSNIFTMFFRDSEVCLEIYDSYGDFGYLTKNQNIFFEEEFLKRTHCPSIITLAQLLFLMLLLSLDKDKGQGVKGSRDKGQRVVEVGLGNPCGAARLRLIIDNCQRAVTPVQTFVPRGWGKCKCSYLVRAEGCELENQLLASVR